MKKRQKIKLMVCLILWLAVVLCLGWTNTLKTNTPAGTDDPREADDRMREIKAAFVERLDVDHYFTASSTSTYDHADTGKHEFITLIDMASDPTQASGYAHIYMKGDELFYQDDTATTCQLTKDGFIEWESINDVNNATWIKSVDNAGTGTINLIQGDANDLAVLPDGTETATNAAPGCSKGVANKKYVDDNTTMVPAVSGPTAGYAGEESVTLPNGLVMKMGITGSISQSSSSAITFGGGSPDPFSTAVISITCTRVEASTANSYGWSVGSVSVDGFTLYSNGARTGTYYWIAIGY